MLTCAQEVFLLQIEAIGLQSKLDVILEFAHGGGPIVVQEIADRVGEHLVGEGTPGRGISRVVKVIDPVGAAADVLRHGGVEQLVTMMFAGEPVLDLSDRVHVVPWVGNSGRNPPDKGVFVLG